MFLVTDLSILDDVIKLIQLRVKPKKRPPKQQ